MLGDLPHEWGPPPPCKRALSIRRVFHIQGYQFLVHPGVLLGILGGYVPPGSPNPDPIADQKMSFFTPVFRPGL